MEQKNDDIDKRKSEPERSLESQIIYNSSLARGTPNIKDLLEEIAQPDNIENDLLNGEGMPTLSNPINTYLSYAKDRIVWQNTIMSL